MAQGATIPAKIRNGRLVKISGNEYIRQLLMLAFGEGESDNPFQDLGLGEFMIFAINDAESEGDIRPRVERMFESFERDQLARLDNPADDIEFFQSEADKYMVVRYRDLETQERVEVEVPIPTP
jgi:hypothetical protein